MGKQHAYAIATRLQQISEDLLQLNQGTLYPALVRLEQQGRIKKGIWARTETNRDAKFYSITKAGGREALPKKRCAGAACPGWWKNFSPREHNHAAISPQVAQSVSGGAAERELDREIQSHLALIQEDLERRGLSAEDARQAARRQYGGIEQAREMHREARSLPWVEQLFQDTGYAARNLLRNPGFTAVAVCALALGIGANTAVFSVVNAVLLKPLAYRDADRLVTLLHSGTDPVAAANYIDWRDRSRSFEAMGAAEVWSANLVGTGSPQHLRGLKVTQNLLPMLGVPPMLGRLFTADEDTPGSSQRVILSYGLRQDSLQGILPPWGKP